MCPELRCCIFERQIYFGRVRWPALWGEYIFEKGHPNKKGEATVWDDIQGNLIGRNLSSVAGKVDYDWAENAITFQSGVSISTQNDVINFNNKNIYIND